MYTPVKISARLRPRAFIATGETRAKMSTWRACVAFLGFFLVVKLHIDRKKKGRDCGHTPNLEVKLEVKVVCLSNLLCETIDGMH